MLVDRVFTPGLAQVAYLVADEDAREVAVIDPRRDVDAYIEWAERREFTIVAILETHVHADFVSGSPELAARTGAPVYASRRGGSEFPHEPLDNGTLVSVGSLVLEAFWTPGHTPEHMSFLLRPDSGADPVALFSGDLLFVGEVGRPDLLGEEHTRELADHLYETLQHRLARLDDEVVVYPGHTAGSSCGRRIGDAPHTTMRDERLGNYALRPQSREQFIDSVLGGMPPAPAYYPFLKGINKAGARPLAQAPVPVPMEPEDVRRALDKGALVIDTRQADAFAQGYMPGSRFAGLGPNFVAWVGWMAPYDRRIVLVVDGEDALRDAITDLHRIGLDDIAGYLPGGISAWRAAGLPLATVRQVTAQELAAGLGDASQTILDVRGPDEFLAGHIPGARHAFAGSIVQGGDVPIEGDQPAAVICGSGYRSLVAVSELAARGHNHLVNVIGGMEQWQDAGLPTVTESAPARELTNA